MHTVKLGVIVETFPLQFLISITIDLSAFFVIMKA